MTPQHSDVIIALTRGYPRTTAGMAVELGVPQASIRRAIHQLREQRYIIVYEPISPVFKELYLETRGTFRLVSRPQRAYRG